MKDELFLGHLKKRGYLKWGEQVLPLLYPVHISYFCFETSLTLVWDSNGDMELPNMHDCNSPVMPWIGH